MSRLPVLPHRCLRILAATTLVLASLMPVTAADEIDALIARPTSPGTLALLIAHVKDPRVASHWRASLSHQSPQVRATAARLLFVSGVRAAVPDLVAVLAQESDPAVALEAAQAALAMGDHAIDEAVLASANRLSDGGLILALARARGSSAIGHIDRIRAMGVQSLPWHALVPAMTAGDASNLDRIADAALAAGDAAMWLAALSVGHDQGLPQTPARVKAALDNPSAVIRAYAWWHVAVVAGNEQLPEGLIVEPLNAQELTGVPANLAFGRELAARVISKVRPATAYPVTPPQPGVELSMPAFGASALYGSLYDLLAKAEREVLNVSKAASVPRSGSEPVAPTDHPALHATGNFPDGYVADVLRLTECKPRRQGVLAGAVVRYTPRKLLQELQWVATPLKPPCAEAARYLLAAALLPAPASVKTGEQVLVALPMGEQYLKCVAGFYASRGEANHVGRKGITPPKKIRDVRPVYPAAAIESRRQGIVIIEATISPAGCVYGMTVLRRVAIDLDIAALLAVSEWAFTPTLLDGQAVPVIMTVTVSFALN